MRRSVTRLAVVAAAGSLLGLGSLTSQVAPAIAAPTWAPAATAPVHPGVQTYTKGAQCTANFIFTDAASVYIGQAAHCAGTGAATDTNGCNAKTLPLGTPVEVTGASRPGTIVYSSWLTMQSLREKDANTCAYNDLALIKLDPADVSRVNPSIPVWGGPTGLNTSGSPFLSRVYSYGNSGLRLGIRRLSPKTGVSLGDTGGGWEHEVFTLTPGIPGDSGSAFLDASGRALGVVSTVAILPIPLSNGIGDIARELNYMRAHGGPAAALALGTVRFNPGALPVG